MSRVAGLASAVWRTARYNRDWPRYIWTGLRVPARDRLVTFRLRNGQTVVTHAATRWVLNEIYLHRVYDVPGVDLASCRTILDIGANVGVFALYASAAAPRASIACFEPASANFAVLERNLRSNRVNARPYRLAVSTTCEPRRLSLDRSAIEYSLTGTGDNSEVVECIDLAAVFRLTSYTVCDFLKLDIEGEERAILTTAPPELLRQVRALAIEWHHSLPELEIVRSRFEESGFDTFVQVEGRELMLKARRR